MAKKEDQCLTCRFWSQCGSFVYKLKTGEFEQHYGQCRRFPPSVPHSQMPEMMVHPNTFPYTWCAEFERAQPNQIKFRQRQEKMQEKAAEKRRATGR